MDLHITSSKTSDAETQTPPKIKMAHSNASLKLYAPVEQPPPPPSLMVVCYKECLKNHAAGLGGYAIDGCGEFMPSPNFNSSNPTSLKCAACDCHRNFHRREAPDSTPKFLNRLQTSAQKSAPANPPQPHPTPLAPRQRGFPSPSSSTSPGGSRSIQSPESSPSPPLVSQFSTPTYHASAPRILLALGNSYNTAPAEEQQRRSSIHQTEVKSENPYGKKRSRTKFSREQKEKMYMFSEKLGWKMQRVEERRMQEFCNEVGVSRYVFKVWMHNNKNKRSDMNISSDRAFSADHDRRDGLNSYNFDGNNNGIQLKQEDSSGNLRVSATGSSP